MKMRKIAILALVSALVLTLTSTASAMMNCEDLTGAEFGQMVSQHARSGHLGADHNPGMHQGYSHGANR